MKDLLCEVMTSTMMEYGRAKAKFGPENNSPHESYAVILEEYEEAKQQMEFFRESLEVYWYNVKNNKDTSEDLEEMLGQAQQAAAEWVQVAAMCFKAGRKPGGAE